MLLSKMRAGGAGHKMVAASAGPAARKPIERPQVRRLSLYCESRAALGRQAGAHGGRGKVSPSAPAHAGELAARSATARIHSNRRKGQESLTCPRLAACYRS